MAPKKTIAIAIMDASYETARSTTALRLIDIAARRGYGINVFAYEGAVLQPFAAQKPHPNAVHGRNVEEENHFIPKDAIAALMRTAERNGGKKHRFASAINRRGRTRGDVRSIRGRSG